MSGKLNWNRVRKIRQTDAAPKRISESASEVFRRALERTNGSSHYGRVLSIQAQYIKNGYISPKQDEYIRRIAAVESTVKKW